MIDVRALPKTNGSNGLHAVPEPVFAQKGDGWMVKIDAKSAETIELRKGTIWAVGILPVFLMLVFYYGTSIFGFIREDQSTKNRVEQLQNDVNLLKQDARDIKETLKNIEVKEAYKLGAGTAHESEKPKAK